MPAEVVAAQPDSTGEFPQGGIPRTIRADTADDLGAVGGTETNDWPRLFIEGYALDRLVPPKRRGGRVETSDGVKRTYLKADRHRGVAIVRDPARGREAIFASKTAIESLPCRENCPGIVEVFVAEIAAARPVEARPEETEEEWERRAYSLYYRAFAVRALVTEFLFALDNMRGAFRRLGWAASGPPGTREPEEDSEDSWSDSTFRDDLLNLILRSPELGASLGLDSLEKIVPGLVPTGGGGGRVVERSVDGAALHRLRLAWMAEAMRSLLVADALTRPKEIVR